MNLDWIDKGAILLALVYVGAIVADLLVAAQFKRDARSGGAK